MVRSASARVFGPGLAIDMAFAAPRRVLVALRSFVSSAAVGARSRPVVGSMATVTPA